MEAPEYPEHDRLRAIADKSQAIYDFLTWAHEERGMVLCESAGHIRGEYYPALTSRQKLLAEFFEIDLNKIEHEKRSMIDHLRALNTPST